MQILTDIAAVRRWRRGVSGTVGFVPTMGFLHEGHIALARAARTGHDHVIASLFVNPLQFDNPEDLEKYPMDIEGDLEKFRGAGVDAVFMPTVDEMYPATATTRVSVGGLAEKFIGAIRPGHFDGVTTVVSKLFHITGPDAAYFGEKDYQQLAIIRQMVRDLDFPIEIIGVPIVRESDGLAMSSRNVRLDAGARAQAVVLNQALDEAGAALDAGERNVTALSAMVRRVISKAERADIRSIDIVDARTLDPVSGGVSASFAILLAVAFGPVLLIDQREYQIPEKE